MLIISSKQTLHCKIAWLFSGFAGTLSPIYSATRSTWSMWSSTSTSWTPSLTEGSQSLGQGWPGSRYVHIGINIYIFCRWLASSETHSVLPDVFPTVSKYFLSNNWNLDYLKILPFPRWQDVLGNSLVLEDTQRSWIFPFCTKLWHFQLWSGIKRF